MSKRIKLVVVQAANREQFDYHVERRAIPAESVTINRARNAWVIDGTEYRYISHPDHLRGLRIDGFERWGEWYLNPDADEIAREAEYRLIVSKAERA